MVLTITVTMVLVVVERSGDAASMRTREQTDAATVGWVIPVRR